METYPKKHFLYACDDNHVASSLLSAASQIPHISGLEPMQLDELISLLVAATLYTVSFAAKIRWNALIMATLYAVSFAAKIQWNVLIAASEASMRPFAVSPHQ